MTNVSKTYAWEQLEQYKALHSLGRFRDCSDAEFAEHARDAATYIQVCHEPARKGIELRKLADSIEEMEYTDPFRDGHRVRAAEQLKRLIPVPKEGEEEGGPLPPWAPWKVELESALQCYRMAGALWAANPDGATKWNARFSQVFPEVWADPDPSLPSKVRPAARRLNEWMENHGIGFIVSVRKPRNRFECEIL